MIIDHVGAIFFPELTILRLIGRIAFPLYCFLLVDAYINIKGDKKRVFKYAICLLLFAIISELPYDLFFHDKMIFLRRQNVLFDLLLGLLFLVAYDHTKENKAYKFIVVYLYIMLSFCLFVNYSIYGAVLIFGLYLYRKNSNLNILIITMLSFMTIQFIPELINYYKEPTVSINNFLIKQSILVGVLVSILPIMNFNGLRGKYNKIIKYFFYIAYPLHIIILLLIKKGI
ncbi:MAG: hypothetical protein IKI57_04515 [Clostridia bacterium]|nr:hypothetical protein [Clostridia bacterium]